MERGFGGQSSMALLSATSSGMPRPHWCPLGPPPSPDPLPQVPGLVFCLLDIKAELRALGSLSSGLACDVGYNYPHLQI